MNKIYILFFILILCAIIFAPRNMMDFYSLLALHALAIPIIIYTFKKEHFNKKTIKYYFLNNFIFGFIRMILFIFGFNEIGVIVIEFLYPILVLLTFIKFQSIKDKKNYLLFYSLFSLTAMFLSDLSTYLLFVGFTYDSKVVSIVYSTMYIWQFSSIIIINVIYHIYYKKNKNRIYIKDNMIKLTKIDKFSIIYLVLIFILLYVVFYYKPATFFLLLFVNIVSIAFAVILFKKRYFNKKIIKYFLFLNITLSILKSIPISLIENTFVYYLIVLSYPIILLKLFLRKKKNKFIKKYFLFFTSISLIFVYFTDIFLLLMLILRNANAYNDNEYLTFFLAYYNIDVLLLLITNVIYFFLLRKSKRPKTLTSHTTT